MMSGEDQGKKKRSIFNFFIKPKLQIRFTFIFIVISLILSFVSLGIAWLVTQIELDAVESAKTAWFLLKATYPGLWIVGVVSIVVGLIVGIFGSRMVALPIFKVEQWSNELKNGNITKQLGMRELDFWGGMAKSCNAFTKELRDSLEALQKSSEADGEVLRSEVKKILSKYRF
jgi:methyl-accepting chemotaxis protein